jgi:hypothetical protein
VERGATTLPVGRVKKLAHLLGVEPEEFVRELVRDYSRFLLTAVSSKVII